jgi:hypothetical protein
MRSFLILCVLATFAIGCDAPTRDRPPRGERRKQRDKKEVVVEPVKTGEFTDMQRTQVASRVTMCKELAAGIRDGSIKSMFDVNKFITERQTSIGVAVNQTLTKRFAADIQSGDGLKSDAADKFDTYALEFEALLK